MSNILEIIKNLESHISEKDRDKIENIKLYKLLFLTIGEHLTIIQNNMNNMEQRIKQLENNSYEYDSRLINTK